MEEGRREGGRNEDGMTQQEREGIAEGDGIRARSLRESNGDLV